MIFFNVGRCQWIIRPLPWGLSSVEADGETYYRIDRQWYFGPWLVQPFGATKPLMKCFSFGPIELRRFTVKIGELTWKK